MTRGSGQTSAQMGRAPQGSVFVSCCQAAVDYDKHLAHVIGRPDLEIMSPSLFDDGAQKLHGRELSGFTIDHAFYDHPETTRSRYDGYRRAMEWIPIRVGRDKRF